MDEAYVRTGKSKVGIWDAPPKKVQPSKPGTMTIDQARQSFLWSFKHVDGASTANTPRAFREFMEYAAYSSGYEGDDYKVFKPYEALAKSVGADLRKEFDHGAADR
jgi:hypothetical protein